MRTITLATLLWAALLLLPATARAQAAGVRHENLETHRLATKACFRLDGENSPMGAANGYYVAIEPLAPGVHVLNFGGILTGMSQAVTYTLVVE